ncbi:MAG TPA: L,D-transpeptidase family protein [Clostridiales bacterium]|nr:L,D-transpeptidase family protein [Clostridiales bacterium]
MDFINMSSLEKRAVIEKIIIWIASIVFLYLIIALYFTNHLFFNTVINGCSLSLKDYKSADRKLRNYVKDYELILIDRDGERESISGEDMGLKYNDKINISVVFQRQKAFYWIVSLFKEQRYDIENLFVFDEEKLREEISKLACLNKIPIEPRNVKFKYKNGIYELQEEVYGNKLNLEILNNKIQLYIKEGSKILDLDQNHCYENPPYTLQSKKTAQTKKLLEQYVSSVIHYRIGDKKITLDGKMLHRWLNVNQNIDVVINRVAIEKFVKDFCNKYDTVGSVRKFMSSTGKMVEVRGGTYGWKIDEKAEIDAIIETIKEGKVIEREPIYEQRAATRDENGDIGNTYVEINITKQHLWFYLNGKLITEGPVVTGNPNRGHPTMTGTFLLNYKQKDVTLTGPGYEAGVTYWMPFYGNIGLHDASWRSSFGGQIYKTRGSHGCVNAPKYLAKIIFEYIEEGTPIICYEE